MNKTNRLNIALLTLTGFAALMPAQPSRAVMTNKTIQAMLSGGVPLPTITQSIKSAPRIDLYMNDRELGDLRASGASLNDAREIMNAIHDREYNGVSLTAVLPPAVSAEPVALASVAPVAPIPAAVQRPAAPELPAVPVSVQPAPAAPAVATRPVAAPRLVLEDATPIRLRISHNLSSADATANQTVNFEVLEEITVGGRVVIAKGATAWGTVTDAEAKRRMGRSGKLNVTIDSVRLANGKKAALRGVKDSKGGSHVGRVTTTVVVTSLVAWPVAPLFLLMHGKDVTIPQGTEITAFISGDMALDATKFPVSAATEE